MSNIITREQALTTNKSRYFTGKACKHGHIAERSTVNGVCIECRRIRQALQNKKYDRKAPRKGPSSRGVTGQTSFTREDIRLRATQWASENPEKILEASRRYYENNRELHNKRASNNRLARTLGITQEEYDYIMKEHDGKCDICDTTDPGGPHKKFNLDHDHATGKIRGVLCRRCNTSIGQFEDSATLLKRAIQYLEDHNTQDLYLS